MWSRLNRESYRTIWTYWTSKLSLKKQRERQILWEMSWGDQGWINTMGVLSCVFYHLWLYFVRVESTSVYKQRLRDCWKRYVLSGVVYPMGSWYYSQLTQCLLMSSKCLWVNTLNTCYKITGRHQGANEFIEVPICNLITSTVLLLKIWRLLFFGTVLLKCAPNL